MKIHAANLKTGIRRAAAWSVKSYAIGRLSAVGLGVLSFALWFNAGPAQTQETSSGRDKIFELKSPDREETVCIYYYPANNISHIDYTGKDKGEVHVQTFNCRVDKLQWLSDNTTIVCLAKANQKSPLHLFCTNLKTGLTRDLSPFAFRSAQAFYLDERGKKVFALLNIDDKARYDLYAVDTATGAMHKIGKAPTKLPERAVIAPAPSAGVQPGSPSTAAGTPSTPASSTTSGTISPATGTTSGTSLAGAHYTYYRSPGVITSAALDSLPLNRHKKNWAAFAKPYEKPLVGQEALVEKYKGRMHQFFLFCPNDGKGDPPNPGKSRLKPWTNAELDQIKVAIDMLSARAPALVLQAAHGKRIQLYRIEQIPSSSFVDSIKKTGNVDGATFGTMVALSDEFFKLPSPGQLDCLSHELTHAADYEHRISFTPEWCKAIGPGVALMHQAAILNRAAKLPLFDDTAATYYALPSAYAGSNYSEALADSVCRYVTGYHNPSPVVLDFLDKHVFAEPQAEPDTVAAFASATDLMKKNQDQEAVKLFNDILKAEPHYFAAYYYRAHAYMKLGKPEHALADSDRCLAMLKSLNIPAYESYYAYAHYERAQFLYILGRVKESRASMKIAFASAPDDPDIAGAYKRVLAGRSPLQQVDSKLNISRRRQKSAQIPSTKR